MGGTDAMVPGVGEAYKRVGNEKRAEPCIGKPQSVGDLAKSSRIGLEWRGAESGNGPRV